MFRRVVFPELFRPRRRTISPVSSSKETGRFQFPDSSFLSARSLVASLNRPPRKAPAHPHPAG